MKIHDTTQKPVTAPCLYLSIPLEVAQDAALSDGAILLFGEIYSLQRAYGRCFASDAHFQTRRSKGRSTIQRQITELSKSGHLYVVNDGQSRRELRVAERYLGGKDRRELPKNETGDRQCPENETEHSALHLINEKEEVSACPKNETRKTLESVIKNQEKRTTPSLFSGGVPSSKLSSEQEKAVKAAVRVLDDMRNGDAYASLYIQASERGRLDAWEVAVAATLKARLKSGHLKQSPIAYFGAVLRASWKLDIDFLRGQSERQNQFQAKATVSQGSSKVTVRQDQKSTSFPSMMFSLNDVADDNCDEEGDQDENDRCDAAPVGDARSLSAYPVAPYNAISDITISESAASAYDTLLAQIPVDQRDEIVRRAKATVQEHHPALWMRGENKPGCVRLITKVCKDLIHQE